MDSEKLLNINYLIKNGRLGHAKIELFKINLKKLPRQSLWYWAYLARRLGYSREALQVLHPFVRPSARKAVESSDFEKAEYAAALIRMGLRTEARSLLTESIFENYPRARMYLAFSYITEWNFTEAEKHFQILLNQKISKEDEQASLTEYDQLIVRVNLVLGFIWLEKYMDAEELIFSTKEICEKKKYFLLLANLLEMECDLWIKKKNFERAEKSILDAKKYLKDTGSIDGLLIRKQEVVFQLSQKIHFREKVDLELKKLLQIKAEASIRGRWETVRDCDFQWTRFRPNPAIRWKLFWGTPYLGFQEKIQKELSRSALPINCRIHRKSVELTLENQKNKIISFKKNQLLDRLWRSLTKDLYRPPQVMDLFEDVFQGEFYHPLYSAQRIHQGLKRLREEFRKNKIAIQIVEKKGFYFLEAQRSVQFILPQSEIESKIEFPELKKYLDISKGVQRLTRQDLVKKLKLSHRTASRLLMSAVESGYLRSVSKGPKTFYEVI